MCLKKSSDFLNCLLETLFFFFKKRPSFNLVKINIVHAEILVTLISSLNVSEMFLFHSSLGYHIFSFCFSKFIVHQKNILMIISIAGIKHNEQVGL